MHPYPRRQVILDRALASPPEARLVVHAQAAHSNRYVTGAPTACVSSQSIMRILESLGRFGRESDWAAHVAAQVARRALTGMYQTDREVAMHIAEALADCAREGWFDVRGATGPAAGPHSRYQRLTTMRQALLMEALSVELSYHLQLGSVPGPGWLLEAMLEAENVNISRVCLPEVHRALAMSAARRVAAAEGNDMG